MVAAELLIVLIKLLQTQIPLGPNDNIYHEGNISRLPDFHMFFSFTISNLMVNAKLEI